MTTTHQATGRPLPVPDESSAPFWAAAARHVLALARCSRCGSLTIPPGQTCPHCGSTDPAFAFVPVSGRGAVRSWTVVRQSFLPGFEADLPFMLVDVELAEQPGLRMIGRLLDGPEAPVRVGAPVEVAFEDVAPGVAVPAFRLGAARDAEADE
ncbi:Zn-ribbon domain-containing OB-fold protein [Actinomadura sp. NTSP31]|uniref:Zn-ribbon domain-containing OB-fold protein n=1 Tax=Actinomadura sp. NTSP31 TaxID=1735447 RepID=UPI0035BFEA94